LCARIFPILRNTVATLYLPKFYKLERFVLKNVGRKLILNSILGPICYHAPSTTFTERVGRFAYSLVQNSVQSEVKVCNSDKPFKEIYLLTYLRLLSIVRFFFLCCFLSIHRFLNFSFVCLCFVVHLTIHYRMYRS
jgi:hypothetical protein